MLLTKVLFGKAPLPRRLFSGKYRIPFIINMRVRRELLRDLAVEEENLFYLRQPYLTAEQEKGTSAALGKGKRKIALINMREKWDHMKKDVYLEDRLDHLKSSDAWE